MIKGIVVGFSFVVALTSNIYSEKIDTFWKEEIKGICTSCVYEHPKEEEHRYADYYDDIDDMDDDKEDDDLKDLVIVDEGYEDESEL